MVWLAKPFPSILETALSRVTLKSRRTFAYYVPQKPAIAANAPMVSDVMLERLTNQLRPSLSSTGRSRGIAIIPFLDRLYEDWFLIRRSSIQERLTFFDADDNEVTISACIGQHPLLFPG